MSSREYHASASLAVIGAAMLAANAAAAFVCTESSFGGPSLAWDNRAIAIALVEGDSGELTHEAIEETLLSALNVWNAPTCSDFLFDYSGAAADPRAGFDWEAGAGQPPNENILVFRSDEIDDDDDVFAVDAWLHPAAALAITTVTFVRSSGRILDADIEVNDAAFEFTNCDPEDCVVVHDLANMLTHELGHVLGLDHPSANTPGARETTMFSSAPLGETQKRDLTEDDSDGLCAIYPVGADNGECAGGQRAEPPAVTLQQTGCSCALPVFGVGKGMLGVAAWIFGALFAYRRPRRILADEVSAATNASGKI